MTLVAFTAGWERGESPRVEEYLDRLGPDQTAERVELIYREFCLSGWSGLDPRPDDYLRRFPEHAEALQRLLRVDAALGSSGMGLWDEPDAAALLPGVGDEIGPYRLIRELGQGAFARVFLAEQADLDDRLVVVKVSARLTPEPVLLARVGHPYVIEVLWHGEANGGSLQLICMPFLGGASLAAVLSERRRRGSRPGSGLDLLDDLDRVSTVGYLPPREKRPAREEIAGLSYPRATALLVARLAEALDFAYGRHVVHGDVKPSNVLLTADGDPMLLDFNLAVRWRSRAGVGELPEDIGGTLAYMAPERLRTVADPGHALRPTANERHRADIYSLGVLLLEMLTGRTPELTGGRRLSPQELASFYVSARDRDGGVMIRSARTSLPAGLRSILAHCLAPDPADRYGRASELAEDLALWRADLPLAFAPEPGRALGLVRSARRKRNVLAAIATGLACAAVVAAVAWRFAEDDGRARALSYLQFVYSEEFGALQFRRPGVGLVMDRGNPAEVAKRHLDRYHVLDPVVDWRGRDEFRKLPTAERDDLEVWLLEQALRFAHALGRRPDSPADWLRALVFLERVTATSACGPLLAECGTLRRQLERPDLPPRDEAATTVPPPRWVVEYLLGVESELRDDARSPRDAMDHYRNVLAIRPGSFWANYRAAAVSFGAKQYASGVTFLSRCVDHRTDNPALRRQFAGCLFMDHRVREALEQSNKARELDPDIAETYVTLSFLRIALKQFDQFKNEINQYDLLKGRLLRPPSEPPVLDLMNLFDGPGDTPQGSSSGHRPAEVLDPDEIDVRGTLAEELAKSGENETALRQFERIIENNPDDLTARFNVASERNTLKWDADREFAVIARHPQFKTLVSGKPKALFAVHKAVSYLIRQGELREALQTAITGVRLADLHEVMQAESYYVLARVYALLARNDVALERDSLESLFRSYNHSPRTVRVWYLAEPAFEDIRAEYGTSPFQAR